MLNLDAYRGTIDHTRADEGIVAGKIFETPLHTYQIKSVQRFHNPCRAATVVADRVHEFRVEVEGIAGMICEERMGRASRLDDVLAKQAK